MTDEEKQEMQVKTDLLRKRLARELEGIHGDIAFISVIGLLAEVIVGCGACESTEKSISMSIFLLKDFVKQTEEQKVKNEQR